MRLGKFRFTQSGARIARISAVPLFVLTLTGWIPNKDLELGPEGPWSWGVYIGLFYFIVGIALLLRPSQSRDPFPDLDPGNES